MLNQPAQLSILAATDDFYELCIEKEKETPGVCTSTQGLDVVPNKTAL